MNLRKTGILLAWAMIIAANGTAQNVQRTSQGIKYAAQGMNVSVEFYSLFHPADTLGKYPQRFFFENLDEASARKFACNK